MKNCKEILGRISEKKEQLAVYFCEDSRKLKLEEVLKHLLTFIAEINEARKVLQDNYKVHVSISCITCMTHCMIQCVG